MERNILMHDFDLKRLQGLLTYKNAHKMDYSSIVTLKKYAFGSSFININISENITSSSLRLIYKWFSYKINERIILFVSCTLPIQYKQLKYVQRYKGL